MKILKGILYLLEMMPVAVIVAVAGLGVEISGFGSKEPVYPLQWLLESQATGFLYAYFAFCFFLVAAGFRKHWFRFVFVRLFFTGIAYFLAGGWVVTGGLSLDGGFEGDTLLQCLQGSPGAWLLYVYLILSFLLFHYGFRIASRLSQRWRVAVYFAVCLLFFGLFWLLSSSISHHYQTIYYEHQSAAEDNPMGEKLHDQMSVILSHITNSVYPEMDEFDSQAIQNGLFDPNCYFDVFTNLWLGKGYELDYKFFRDWFAGQPLIYARKTNELTADPEDDIAWNLRIHLSGSPESYLEYVALYLFADQFYLMGHAFQYSEGRVISSKAAFDELINGRLRLGPKSVQKGCALDFFPRVSVGQNLVEVSIVTFSRWGGLVRKTVVMEKEFPHRILEENMDWETLIDYDCGIRF